LKIQRNVLPEVNSRQRGSFVLPYGVKWFVFRLVICLQERRSGTIVRGKRVSVAPGTRSRTIHLPEWPQ